MSRSIGTLPHRLWSRVKFLESGCWEWQGYRRPPGGYGQIGAGRKDWGIMETHRLAWILHHQEEIPDGLIVRHTCDNPPCCNPNHLVLGTHADNGRDRDERGRTKRGPALPQTKLTDESVKAIRLLWGTGLTQTEIGQMFGVTQCYVSEIVNGKYRKDVA